MADKSQAISGMSTRQKVTAGLMVIVVLIVLWQVIGLFRDSSSGPVTPSNTNMAASSTVPAGPASSSAPKEVDIMAPKVMTAQEMEMMKIQQESEARYLQALNELQMLKVAKDIADANKEISASKLARVASETKIVELLAPPPPPPVDVTSTPAALQQTQQQSFLDQGAKYTVVSISQLQNRWSAILGYKGVLYNVHVGETLTADGSLVVSIRRDGVTLSKDGQKNRLSLVPTL